MLEAQSQKYSRSRRRKRRESNEMLEEEEEVESNKLLEMSMTKTKECIPNDIIVEILLRLPGKSLIQFRWACKYWFDLIRDPKFVKLQLMNHSINNPLLMLSRYDTAGSLVLSSLKCMNDYENSDDGLSSSRDYSLPAVTRLFECHGKSDGSMVVGSCNGLLCIWRWTWGSTMNRINTICVWNPCTNEFKESSTVPTDVFAEGMIVPRNFRNSYFYGFGYDQTIDDYKVISNTTFWVDDHYVTVVQVYTLGTNSWKRIGNYHMFYISSITSFDLNGASFCCIAQKFSLESYLHVILCFNIAKEEYREISKPWFVDNLSLVRLTVLNGCLCIVQNASPKSRAVEVWMLKDYYCDDMNKNECSWTKQFTIREPRIRCPHLFKPLRIFNKNNGGEILIRLHSYQDLVWYNVKDDKIRITRSRKVCENVKKVDAYIESLVSLNSGTYMGHEEQEEECTTIRQDRKNKQKM